MAVTVTVTGAQLYRLGQGLPSVRPGRVVPTSLLVRLRRLRSAIAEYYGPLDDQIKPLVAKHTDGASTIEVGHPNRAAFNAEAAPLWAEELEIELDPVPLSVLDSDAVVMDAEVFDLLVELGVIVDDEQEAQAP